MDVDMESFQLESPPSPAPSYLSMESDDDDLPVEADKTPGGIPERVCLERPESPGTYRSETAQSSIQPGEGAFFPAHGSGLHQDQSGRRAFVPISRVRLERPESPETCRSETAQSSIQPSEGAFFSGHGSGLHQDQSGRRAFVPISRPEMPPQPASSHTMELQLDDMDLEKEEKLSPMEMSFIFKSIQSCLELLMEKELSLFKRHLERHYSEYFTTPLAECDVLDVVDMMLERCGKMDAIKLALNVLKSMKRKDLADFLQAKCRKFMLQYELKEYLTMKHSSIYEGVPRQGQHCLLNHMYMDVHMAEGGNGEINEEHEVRQSESTSGSLFRPEEALKPSDLFEPSFVRERNIRNVLTRGIAGIGLSVAVQKFVIDWAEERANQDIEFVFPIRFGVQNTVKPREQSLFDYLTIFYPEIREMDFIDSPDCKVLFIFDGLDECQHTLSFQTNGIWTDPKAATSIDMLLTNLIRGNLLPSSRIWITTRTAATNMIPANCVDLLTQVNGFTELQRDLYFRKKISDPNQARRILEYVKSSRSLYIMCHVPVFCWVMVTILEKQIYGDGQDEPPMTVTELFTHYVFLQTNSMHTKYVRLHSAVAQWTAEDRDFLMKLGELALKLLEKGRIEFSVGDLREFDLDVDKAIVQSGLCTELFLPHSEPQRRVFRFVHLSMQEYLAAFYVYMSFRVKRRGLFAQARAGPPAKLFKSATLVDLLCSAVDKALKSQNGHLDMFLRFLLGLSVDTIQRIFRPFIVPLPKSSAQCIEETVRFIRKKIEENRNADRCRNLRHCLAELEG